MQKDDPFRTATIQWFSESDIDELTDVWEASVRKTHDFLNEHEILLYRQAVHDRYLVTLSPFGIRIGKTIAAFCAVQDETIEMLFVAPEHQGRGLGSRLLDRAIQELRATRVDVNEQNRPAEKRIPDNGTRRIRSARNQASDPPSVATRKPASERFGTK